MHHKRVRAVQESDKHEHQQHGQSICLARRRSTRIRQRATRPMTLSVAKLTADTAQRSEPKHGQDGHFIPRMYATEEKWAAKATHDTGEVTVHQLTCDIAQARYDRDHKQHDQLIAIWRMHAVEEMYATKAACDAGPGVCCQSHC
eukprot:TRINITY_DN985_c0_g1_i10.p2 TRINITY_DN985_c0_g1~~TRINITY_DN985_c0_g1_i10.p2  ORF type:complete len:145 (-),score=18.61 TRINITY_DN985_c0_g1_i10:1711-2145(-)